MENITSRKSQEARSFDDLSVREAVEAELAWTPDVHSPRIGVSVRDGVVTLNGDVDALHERIAAVNAAERVRGVRTVADELRLPTGAARPEGRRLADAVNAILAWTSGVPHDGIHAEVHGHNVVLTGAVDWDAERVAAKKAIQRVYGVESVDNRIRLTRRPVAADIAEEIRNAIVRSAVLDASHISVAADDAEVTLTGSVRSWVERQQAVRTAWSSPNVTEVHDRLQVNP